MKYSSKVYYNKNKLSYVNYRKVVKSTEWQYCFNGCGYFLLMGRPLGLPCCKYKSSVMKLKVKVKLSLCLTKHYAIKTYWG